MLAFYITGFNNFITTPKFLIALYKHTNDGITFGIYYTVSSLNHVLLAYKIA